MTAPDPRLDEIQARLGAHYESIAYEDDIPEGQEDDFPEDYERHYCAEDGKDWPCPDVTDYAQEDIRYLLAELRKAHEALERVEAITDEMDETAALRATNAEIKSYYGTRIRAAVAAAKGDER